MRNRAILRAGSIRYFQINCILHARHDPSIVYEHRDFKPSQDVRLFPSFVLSSIVSSTAMSCISISHPTQIRKKHSWPCTPASILSSKPCRVHPKQTEDSSSSGLQRLASSDHRPAHTHPIKTASHQIFNVDNLHPPALAFLLRSSR